MAEVLFLTAIVSMVALAARAASENQRRAIAGMGADVDEDLAAPAFTVDVPDR